MADLSLKDEVYQIIGAALDVYWHLGRGFLEGVYREAMEIELSRRHIPFQSRHPVLIFYKDQPLEKTYISDMIVFGQIIAEFKACDRLCGSDESQLLHYLKATGMRVGLLINFGCALRFEWKRYLI